jgi:hypothetical protein
MFLRELFEAEKKMASFALGRLNPATSGHELLVDAIKKAPGDSFLFLTDRAPKLPTDPLTPQDKLDWARKSFDGISIGLAKTVLTAADRLYKMGYTEVTFLEGEPKLLKILKQYNGQEKETHNYNFQKIDYVQLQRDAEANDATGMSASKLRQTVLDNDMDAFTGGVTKQAMPHAEEMFKKLQGLMGVDSVEEADVKPGSALPKTIKPIKMPTPPQAPTGPDGTDENGTQTGTTPKGNRSVKSGAGTYIFTPKGKLMLYMTPKIGGLQQTHNIAKKTITVNFGTTIDGAGIDQKATYDMGGKLISGDNTSIRSGDMGLSVDKDKGTTVDYTVKPGLKVSANSKTGIKVN